MSPLPKLPIPAGTGELLSSGLQLLVSHLGERSHHDQEREAMHLAYQQQSQRAELAREHLHYQHQYRLSELRADVHHFDQALKSMNNTQRHQAKNAKAVRKNLKKLLKLLHAPHILPEERAQIYQIWAQCNQQLVQLGAQQVDLGKSISSLVANPRRTSESYQLSHAKED